MKVANERFVNFAIVKRLAGALACGRLAHAYLLAGPRGTGKLDTALEIARMVNCLAPGGFESGCACAACARISAGNHPDVHVVRREEDRTRLRIEQIRDLAAVFNLRTYEARMRVVILVEVADMNDEASNAFLKTLEEPVKSTLLLLTTSAPDKLLTTIRSRCQLITLPARSKSSLAQLLKSEYHIPSPDAEVLAGFSRGSPGRALELQDGFIQRRNAIIDRFILGKPTWDYIKTLTEDRDTAREFLEVVLTYYRDAALLAAGAAPEQLVHEDRLADLRHTATNLSAEKLGRVIDATVGAIRGMRENMNVRISLTVLKEMM